LTSVINASDTGPDFNADLDPLTAVSRIRIETLQMPEHRNNTVLLFRWMLTSVRRSHTSTRCSYIFYIIFNQISH
jgi:hypothetical protein